MKDKLVQSRWIYTVSQDKINSQKMLKDETTISGSAFQELAALENEGVIVHILCRSLQLG